MSLADLQAAVDRLDSQASISHLVGLLTGDHSLSEKELTVSAGEYLTEFTNRHQHTQKRRWTGLALCHIIASSQDVANHLQTLPLHTLGDVVLGDTMEELRYVAGLIMRNLLLAGTDYCGFWTSDRVPNSVPSCSFPLSLGSKWFPEYGEYLDLLCSMKLLPESVGAGIIYAISAFSSDEFSCTPFDTALMVLMQDQHVTLIAPASSVQGITFIDLPVHHITCYKVQKAVLHNSQTKEGNAKPWSVTVTLKGGAWTYLVNTTQQHGRDVTIIFEGKEDAKELEACIQGSIENNPEAPRSSVRTMSLQQSPTPPRQISNGIAQSFEPHENMGFTQQPSAQGTAVEPSLLLENKAGEAPNADLTSKTRANINSIPAAGPFESDLRKPNWGIREQAPTGVNDNCESDSFEEKAALALSTSGSEPSSKLSSRMSQTSRGIAKRRHIDTSVDDTNDGTDETSVGVNQEFQKSVPPIAKPKPSKPLPNLPAAKQSRQQAQTSASNHGENDDVGGNAAPAKKQARKAATGALPSVKKSSVNNAVSDPSAQQDRDIYTFPDSPSRTRKHSKRGKLTKPPAVRGEPQTSSRSAKGASSSSSKLKPNAKRPGVPETQDIGGREDETDSSTTNPSLTGLHSQRSTADMTGIAKPDTQQQATGDTGAPPAVASPVTSPVSSGNVREQPDSSSSNTMTKLCTITNPSKSRVTKTAAFKRPSTVDIYNIPPDEESQKKRTRRSGRRVVDYNESQSSSYRDSESDYAGAQRTTARSRGDSRKVTMSKKSVALKKRDFRPAAARKDTRQESLSINATKANAQSQIVVASADSIVGKLIGKSQPAAAGTRPVRGAKSQTPVSGRKPDTVGTPEVGGSAELPIELSDGRTSSSSMSTEASEGEHPVLSHPMKPSAKWTTEQKHDRKDAMLPQERSASTPMRSLLGFDKVNTYEQEMKANWKTASQPAMVAHSSPNADTALAVEDERAFVLPQDEKDPVSTPATCINPPHSSQHEMREAGEKADDTASSSKNSTERAQRESAPGQSAHRSNRDRFQPCDDAASTVESTNASKSVKISAIVHVPTTRKRPADFSAPNTPDLKRTKVAEGDITTQTGEQQGLMKPPPTFTCARIVNDPTSPCPNEKRARRSCASVSAQKALQYLAETLEETIEDDDGAAHARQATAALPRSRSSATPLGHGIEPKIVAVSGGAQILSSNSKPLPSSPNAGSTAITRTVSREEVELEIEIGLHKASKKDPFNLRPLDQKPKETSFLRRCSGPFTGIVEPVVPSSSPLPEISHPDSSRFGLLGRVSAVSRQAESPLTTRKISMRQFKQLNTPAFGAHISAWQKQETQPFEQNRPRDNILGESKTQLPKAAKAAAVAAVKESRELDGTLVEDEYHGETLLPSSSPTYMSSSPPPSSTHSSTSANDRLESDPTIPTDDVEEMEWEANLQPHQRSLGEQLVRVAKRVHRHAVNSEVAVNDIADMYAEDGEQMVGSLFIKHKEEHNSLFAGLNSTKRVMKRDFDSFVDKLKGERGRLFDELGEGTEEYMK